MNSITIRELHHDDIKAHIALADDPEIQRLSLFQAAKKRGGNLEFLFNKLADLNVQESLYCSFSIVDDDIVVGYLNALYPKEPNGVAQIGVWIGQEHRGKGYGVKAINALIDHIQNTYPDMSIQFSIRNDNRASFALFNKIANDHAIRTVFKPKSEFSSFEII